MAQQRIEEMLRVRGEGYLRFRLRGRGQGARLSRLRDRKAGGKGVGPAGEVAPDYFPLGLPEGVAHGLAPWLGLCPGQGIPLTHKPRRP